MYDSAPATRRHDTARRRAFAAADGHDGRGHFTSYEKDYAASARRAARHGGSRGDERKYEPVPGAYCVADDDARFSNAGDEQLAAVRPTMPRASAMSISPVEPATGRGNVASRRQTRLRISGPRR